MRRKNSPDTFETQLVSRLLTLQDGSSDEAKNQCVRGEMALWRAVITQALMDAANPSTRYVQARQDAIAWLTCGSADFNRICDYAGFDPRYVRRMAKRALLVNCQWRAAPGRGNRAAYTASRNKKARQKTRLPQSA